MTKTLTNNNFDLIIIGGGLAGASLACALRNSALKIALVEAYQLNTDSQPSYDDRTVALSYGSRCIFDGLGLWSSLAPYAEAINNIHISDRGHFGVTRLSKQQEGVEALGYVLENRDIGQQLYAVINKTKNIRLFCPAQLKALQQDARQVSVELAIDGTSDSKPDGKPQKLSANLLVAADGNNSQVMKLLAIGSSRKSYNQVALISNVTPGNKHNNVAYERFTDSGPLALLPMLQNRCSLVWTLDPKQADDLYALDETDFLQQLQQRFGYRLGQFKKAGKRQLYPLFLQAATQMVQGRVALIGNAAHSVHPVAGQGFNMALRDIALLSELIVDSLPELPSELQVDIGKQTLLQSYANSREDDIQRVYRFTDTLVKTFSNNITALAHLRSLGLLMVDVLPDLKHRLAAQNMGMSGHLSRLNRGLPL
ncbi:2-octaprenyl-6-methoxyphenyl hydroxylase [Cardiobacterium sp. AH-315-I02]|nr:2-octaprenyl-6-methoxyphenyl hydroxylase [Cardiobacterium sp. AH-315-I02]